MDFELIKELLINSLLEKGYLSLDFDSEDESSITFIGSRDVPEIDDACGVMINLFVDEEDPNLSCVNIIYQFDELEHSLSSYMKINMYNACVPFFKAYIMDLEEGPILSFQVSTTLHGDERNVVDMICELDTEFDAENALPYLVNLFKQEDCKD